MNASDFFKHLQAKMPQLKSDLGRKIVTGEAMAFVEKNFRDEGFNRAGGIDKWDKRAHDTGAQRALLVKSSTLKGHALNPRRLNDGASFVFPLEYEKLHNEGGKVTITPQMRGFFWSMWYKTKNDFWKHLALTKKTELTMPKRQFIGQSDYLDNRIKKKIDQYMQKFFNNLI